MHEDLISVIIPIHNTSQFLDQCIQSIMSQTYKNTEIILVNDGSTDHSEEISLYYKNLDDRIQYFYKENSGCGLTRNYGLDKAKGKYVYFLDSDDYVAPTLLEKLHDSIKSGDSFSGLLQFYFDRSVGLKRFEINEPEHRTLKSPAVWSRLFNKDIIEKSQIRFSSAPIGEDLEFVAKLLIYNNQCTYIDNEPLYYYRIHQASISHDTSVNTMCILQVLDQIEQYAKQMNRYYEFYSLIEFMTVSHTYFAAKKIERQENCNLDNVKRCLDYIVSKYPDWAKNVYVNAYFTEQATILQEMLEKYNSKTY